jgi:hypothetical protein
MKDMPTNTGEEKRNRSSICHTDLELTVRKLEDPRKKEKTG